MLFPIAETCTAKPLYTNSQHGGYSGVLDPRLRQFRRKPYAERRFEQYKSKNRSLTDVSHLSKVVASEKATPSAEGLTLIPMHLHKRGYARGRATVIAGVPRFVVEILGCEAPFSLPYFFLAEIRVFPRVCCQISHSTR